MISKQTIIFMVVTIFIIDAMGSENVCHLAHLPAEIHAHIALYLTFPNSESDEEFIARSRASENITQEHREILEKHEQGNYRWGGGSLGIIRTYSVDDSKIISLEKVAENPRVTIFDTHNKTERESVHLATLFKEDMLGIKHIAFSRNGTRCAQLQAQEIEVNWLKEWQHWIIIKNILSDEIQQFLIPANYENFISIGFNKQGTKIIVHAKEDLFWNDFILGKSKSKSIYHIVPLTTPEEHKEKNEQTLEAYLRCMACCKDLTKSK